MMSSRKKIVERELGVKIPAQYDAFLQKYGVFHAPGVEVFGMSDDLVDYDGIPCVIGATQIRRRRYGLPHRFLVLHYSGFEDEFICLDTEDEKVYAFSRFFGDRKIADSFDVWFERDILEYVRERHRRRDESEDDWD